MWTEVAPYIYCVGGILTYIVGPLIYVPWVTIVWLQTEVQVWSSIYFSWNICFASI
jgi:hypothetical protein